jgi:septum formation protein
MTECLVLASGSTIRQTLLRNAGLEFKACPVRIDESSIRDSMLSEGATPRDVADALAEQKARRGSQKQPGALVLGCDQVLDFKGQVLSKPESPQQAREQLDALNGNMHQLLSAAVLYQDGRPLWRHVGVVRLTMRNASAGYLDDYVARNWDSIRHSVGAYKLEEEGVRLFHRVEGDYFNVLGLPLLELLSYLTLKGAISG